MSVTTEAYNRYKAQSDALLNFIVLVSYAVPALLGDISDVRGGLKTSLLKSDFFHKSNRSGVEALEHTARHYEKYLSMYLVLAQFSFFDAFVQNLVQEFVDFQGGGDQFASRIARRTRRFLSRQVSTSRPSKRKLQDSHSATLRDKYAHYSRVLEQEGFRFPGDLLAAYGVKELVSRSRGVRASHPRFVARCFSGRDHVTRNDSVSQ
jgi:hypothetical protein